MTAVWITAAVDVGLVMAGACALAGWILGTRQRRP